MFKPFPSSPLHGGLVSAILVVCFIWWCILPAAALSVTAGPSVEPEGEVVVGEAMTADITFIYDVSSMNEFITVYTDLGSASWDAVIIADSREMPIGRRNGRYLTITGFELYNSGSSVTKLQIHLEGVVPDYMAGAGQAEVFTIEHIAGDGSTVLDTVSENISIIDLAEVNAMRMETENGLILFEEEISDAYSAGTDTAAAEEAAADIRDLIDASRQMDIRNAYRALSEADALLRSASAKVTDSVTQDRFQAAEEMIAAIEPALADYRNAGGGDEQGILVVRSYCDHAEMLLLLAQEKKVSGDTAGAEQYAADAYEKAEDAMAYLAAMYSEMGLTMEGSLLVDCPTPSPDMSYSSLPSYTSPLPDTTDSEQGNIFGIDIEGTAAFIQVILDGCTGFASFISDVSDAFSEIGN